ncbi:hypothetical protein GGD61_005094 [Bradyrhizobium sp. SBR1B]|nr:hypothetical protein [Bradyrhizobium sp. SBR1B]
MRVRDSQVTHDPLIFGRLLHQSHVPAVRGDSYPLGFQTTQKWDQTLDFASDNSGAAHM